MSDVNRSALEGITVCDFSWVGAGPITTNALAQCGAKVIKIESAKRPDLLRKGEPFKDGDSTGLERSGYFANRNPNKKGIALNMSRPEARDVAVRLIEKSDIVINNFRVGQMEKWRLGWEDVQRINPRAVYVTMSLQGTEGPHSSFMGFGFNLNALCGLTARSCFEGRRPFGTGTNYTDHVMVPTHTLFGIMAALLNREKTGRGMVVDVSQLNSALCLVPTSPMAWAAGEQKLGPLGFGDDQAAPHGVYPTLGYRKWLALAVLSEDHWQSLLKVMDRPELAGEVRFADAESRLANRDELDRLMEDWTSRLFTQDAARMLQAAGIPAGVVNDARGAIEDEHLRQRDYWAYLDHPVMGSTLYNRIPMVFHRTPTRMETAAPLLGQHTDEVLTGLLGYSAGEVEQLKEQEVLV